MNIGGVLGWKFNHEPGITTKDNILVDWPLSLGARPTQVQIDGFAIEFAEFEDERTSIEERVVTIAKERERKEAVLQLKIEGKTFNHFDNNGNRI